MKFEIVVGFYVKSIRICCHQHLREEEMYIKNMFKPYIIQITFYTERIQKNEFKINRDKSYDNIQKKI